MRTRKTVFLAMVLAIFLLCAATANAAWYVCTVNEVGASAASGSVFVNLTDTAGSPAFSNTWFRCTRTEQVNRVLAVGLTAQSNDREVNVDLQDTAAWSEINGIFSRNQ